MRIPIFLSYPKPHLVCQECFIQQLSKYLQNRGLEPRTLGVTDYDMDAPLKAIRRLMLESNGLITIAFRRTFVENSVIRKSADIPNLNEKSSASYWLTSPYCQIEPAMAYQLGIPILIFRETGVLADGLLEKGVVGCYMPEFSLEKSAEQIMQGEEFQQMIGKWEGLVRTVVDRKGSPPQLY